METMSIKYVHTNIISKNWKKLSAFYQSVFECTPVPPIRDLSGSWLDKGTGLNNAHLKGIHLRLPGYGDKGPTLEIYQYDEMENKSGEIVVNQQGFRHIAFLVNDINLMYEKVLENGGRILGEITTKEVTNVGLLTFVYICDPEDNIIELQNWS
jgi:predicted enzyme related to lactoylglutathione lyase